MKKQAKVSDEISNILDDIKKLPLFSGENVAEYGYRTPYIIYNEMYNFDDMKQDIIYPSNIKTNNNKGNQPPNSKPKSKQKQKGKQKQQNNNNNKGKQKQNNKKKGGNNNNAPAIARVELLVGKIIEIKDHPGGDKMYVEMIDIGRDKPRQIISGIREHFDKKDLLNTKLIVVTNLKPRPMKGVTSYGMILAASNDDHSYLEIVRPPDDSIVGERITLENMDVNEYKPDNEIKPNKKNSPWAKIKNLLKTNDNMEACFDGNRFMTSKGPLTVKSLKNAQLS